MVADEVESSCQLVVTFFFFFFLVSPYQTIEISLGQPSPPSYQLLAPPLDLNEGESGTSESDTESYPESSCGQISVLSSDSPCCSQSIANAETNNDLNDPSLPLPSNETERNARIRKGPYQLRLNNYTVTRHIGKARSFCQRWYDFYNWLEYSPITNKMYCFFCRIFAHKVMGPGNTGAIDPAFATNGTQAQRWKKARSALSKHQSCFVHKQSALFHADFLKYIPIKATPNKTVASRPEVFVFQCGREAYYHYSLLKIRLLY